MSSLQSSIDLGAQSHGGAWSRAAGSPCGQEPVEVAWASVWDASWEFPGHAGGTVTLSWPGNASGFPRMSWRKEREVCLYSDGCPRAPATDKAEENGWVSV